MLRLAMGTKRLLAKTPLEPLNAREARRAGFSFLSCGPKWSICKNLQVGLPCKVFSTCLVMFFLKRRHTSIRSTAYSASNLLILRLPSFSSSVGWIVIAYPALFTSLLGWQGTTFPIIVIFVAPLLLS